MRGQQDKQASERTVPSKRAMERQAEVFKALGHPGRMAIVHALAGGEVCACALAQVAGFGASSASRHLQVLRQAGLIADERRGQQIYYRLVYPCVVAFAECVDHTDEGRLGGGGGCGCKGK